MLYDPFYNISVISGHFACIYTALISWTGHVSTEPQPVSKCLPLPTVLFILTQWASGMDFWKCADRCMNVYYKNTPIQIYWKFHHQKNWKFSVKNSDIFHISAQNIYCGYSLEPPRPGGSNEYPQSMFLSRNKKNNVYPYKPQFYYIKVGFKGVKLYRYVSVM